MAISRSNQSPDYAIIPPDGGWGWVVALAAFYCQIIIDGIQLTFGMVLKEMADSYQVEYSSVALVGSFIYGMHYICGPLCAGLCQLWGDRTVAIIGAITAGACLPIAYFGVPIYALYITSGILGGAGLGFVNMTSIVMTTIYFSKYRLLVMGLVTCGTGVGTMVFASSANYVLQKLGWRYVCLLEGLLALSLSLAGLTFRPLAPTKIHTDPLLTPEELYIEERVSLESHQVELNDEALDDNARLYFISTESVDSRPIGSTSTFTEKTEEVLVTIATITAGHGLSRRRKCQCRMWKCFSPFCQPRRHQRFVALNPETELLKKQKDVIREISLLDDEKGTTCAEKCFSTLAALIDCRILKSWAFLTYTVAVALSAAAMIIVMFYEKVRFLKLGLTPNEATISLVWMGATNTFWRIVIGFFSTILKANYSALNIAGLFLGGIATVASGAVASAYWNYFCSSLFSLATGWLSSIEMEQNPISLFSACFAVFYPTICVEMVGSEQLSNATGVSMMFMGIFSVIGAPLSGLVYKITGDINWIFYISGIMFLASSTAFILIFGRKVPKTTSE